MDQSLRIGIIIAALNEEKVIGEVIASLPRTVKNCHLDCIVVDDGSSDGTVKRAEQEGATVLCHAINRGQGAALKTGFDFALAKEYDVVITFDADNQHRAADIPAMLDLILNDEAEIVLGSRFLEKKTSSMPPARMLVLKIGVAFTRILSRVRVTDTHNGFRAIHRRALQKLQLVQDRMEHASEIIDQIGRHRIPFREVPVTIDYTDYSKAKGQRNSGALKIALKMVVHKLAR